jgi:hypothetical protein
LFCNSPKECAANFDFAFNIGLTWKLSDHFNLLFSAGRDIVGDSHAMAYQTPASHKVNLELFAQPKPMIANATLAILCHDAGSPKTFTHALGSKTGKDFVPTIKHGSNDRVPEPGCHKTGV